MLWKIVEKKSIFYSRTMKQDPLVNFDIVFLNVDLYQDESKNFSL